MAQECDISPKLPPASVREPDDRDFVVTASHLHKRYGPTVAVEDISFSVLKGEIFGIIGPNGAGKTTTVECISGLRTPDSGSVRVFGLDPTSQRSEIKREVGVQLQESSLPPRLSVWDALDQFASFYSRPLDPKNLLESLGIWEKRNTNFKRLSGGQKQRLSIALALVGNPRVAVLDELTTGLDPDARRETWKLIEQVRDAGVTIILVTHYMDEAERLCDRVALINRGKLAALDTPAGMASLYGDINRVQFLPSGAFEDKVLTSIPGVTSLERKGSQVIVTGTGDLAPKILYALLNVGVRVEDLQIKLGNLEDAFVKLTEGGLKK